METILLLDPRGRLDHIPLHVRSVHIRVTALRLHVEELKPAIIARIVQPAGRVDLLNVNNNLNDVTVETKGVGMAEYSKAAALLKLMEDSTEYQEAVAIMEPLLALCAKDAAEDQAKALALLEAEELVIVTQRRVHAERIAQAEADALNDPEVAKAKKALEKVQAAQAV